MATGQLNACVFAGLPGELRRGAGQRVRLRADRPAGLHRPGGLVFITGKMDGLIMVSGRRHNADDIVATALAVEPMKFVYREGEWDRDQSAMKSH